MTDEMSEDRAVIERFVDALNHRDFSALTEVLHPDYVEELPQSRERIRGRDNWLEILKNYPGGVPGLTERGQMVGSEQQVFMTPAFSLIRATCDRGKAACYARCRYPDGSEWFGVWFVTLREGRLTRSVVLHAPIFDPPEWRTQWVERMETPLEERPAPPSSAEETAPPR
jgi:hypothetical protein